MPVVTCADSGRLRHLDRGDNVRLRTPDGLPHAPSPLYVLPMVACIVVGLLAVHLPQRPFVKFVYSSRGSTYASALREIDGWAGSAGTAAETPAAVGAGHVLGIPSALASFQGPAASAQYQLVSLADTFSQELADAFQRRRADVMVKLKHQDFWLWLQDFRQTQPRNPRQKSATEGGRNSV